MVIPSTGAPPVGAGPSCAKCSPLHRCRQAWYGPLTNRFSVQGDRRRAKLTAVVKYDPAQGMQLGGDPVAVRQSRKQGSQRLLLQRIAMRQRTRAASFATLGHRDGDHAEAGSLMREQRRRIIAGIDRGES